jgi:hypothetical protein
LQSIISRALKSILGYKKEGVTGDWKKCMIRNLMFGGSFPILGSLCQRGQDEQDIWHERDRKK